MTKKEYVALADVIRLYDVHCFQRPLLPFTDAQVELLADFISDHNPRFNRQRWLDYIAGKAEPEQITSPDINAIVENMTV